MAAIMVLAALLGVSGAQGAGEVLASSSAIHRHGRCAKLRHQRWGHAHHAHRRSCRRHNARRAGALGGKNSTVRPTSPEESTANLAVPEATSATSGTKPQGSTETSITRESSTHFRFFSASSFWNAPLAENAALDTHSAEIVGTFETEINQELNAEEGPAINTTAYSVPIYIATGNQQPVKVTLKRSSTALQSAWEAVPLPANAQPAAGTDHHLVVWQPSTERLWEFWRLENTTEGWQAGWGGAMEHVMSNHGVYAPEAWPGATRWWGASASSLSIAGGLITLEDLERGEINHALAMAIPHVRATVYSLPAYRTDGKTESALALPEGAHLRLDPKLNLANLHLPHITQEIAEAAQKYGIFVRDGSHTVCLYAQDPTPTGTNPYIGASGYFEGLRRPLAYFPWQHLQLLNMTLE